MGFASLKNESLRGRHFEQSKTDGHCEGEARGNPFSFGAGFGFSQSPEDADCHTSDVGHWFAMTFFGCVRTGSQ